MKVLDYHTPRAAWRIFIARLWKGAVLSGSHMVGAICCWISLTAVATIIAESMVLILIANEFLSLGEADGPPPILIPIVGGIFALVGLVIAVGLATFCAAVTILAGISLDAARRPLRCPALLVPMIFGAGVWAAWSVKCLLAGDPFWVAARNPITASALMTLGLCTYWIPMMCSETFLRIAAWICKRVCQWYSERRWRKTPGDQVLAKAEVITISARGA